MCLSDQEYVPLNDGYNWKGDPNATLSGQDVPQLPPGSPPSPLLHPVPQPAPVPIAAAQYDPATGSYVGPDGRTYTQSDLGQNAPQERQWQSMLIPPGS
jgi:phospholipid/cholesterol/gamma-HCH transport system substrate-binding protein